ncbi:hypothetical protein [Agromyces italicus]|uniref:hypothetical protein n=1 Tax=Agromyces italicus TaxID=279572 RepID=UPI0003B5AC1C|nr:hypothetical protein [Agromyces italicus]
MTDVAIEKAALEGAIINVDATLGQYVAYANDLWARDTGVGNPVGRTALRVMLENALGQAALEVRDHHASGVAISGRLREINESFDALDVSLGAGWDDDSVADFA